ncbi:hypothetical protein AUJ68_05300 [Candidatus Woesearchaeota archaeon CG1_02_57_44]|nr:MAG: hypothetical protein AUJ68_05300 [Candidatus Woesearchaeota archaeon CG1_02_57_44]
MQRTPDDEKVPFGKRFLPIVARANLAGLITALQSNHIDSVSPAPFVGHQGYPKVNVGLLSPPTLPDAPELLDAPREWAQRQYGISQVVNIRTSLVNARQRMDIGAANPSPTLQTAQEIALAFRPPEVDIAIAKPHLSHSFSQFAAPVGPTAEWKQADIGNTRLDQALEQAYYDTDLLASDAIATLWHKGRDETQIARAMSVGTLGKGDARKLVPTRWSITAVDDTLGKQLLNDVRVLEHQKEHLAFFGSHLGNHYLVLLLPGSFCYELYEISVSKAYGFGQYNTDFEPFEGRKSYAQNTVGGYYAARLSILEQLKAMNHQAGVLCLRFITDEYEAPLGVWVVREAARNAMQAAPLRFTERKLLFNYAQAVAQRKFSFDVSNILKDCLLLRQSTQAKLSQFA